MSVEKVSNDKEMEDSDVNSHNDEDYHMNIDFVDKHDINVESVSILQDECYRKSIDSICARASYEALKKVEFVQDIDVLIAAKNSWDKSVELNNSRLKYLNLIKEITNCREPEKLDSKIKITEAKRDKNLFGYCNVVIKIFEIKERECVRWGKSLDESEKEEIEIVRSKLRDLKIKYKKEHEVTSKPSGNSAPSDSERYPNATSGRGSHESSYNRQDTYEPVSDSYGHHYSGRGSFDSGRGGRGRGSFDSGRGRGSFDSGRGRGSFDSGRGRGSFDSGRGRGAFDSGRGRGAFDSGRGRGSFRGRGIHGEN
jgi:hypothetical protein